MSTWMTTGQWVLWAGAMLGLVLGLVLIWGLFLNRKKAQKPETSPPRPSPLHLLQVGPVRVPPSALGSFHMRWPLLRREERGTSLITHVGMMIQAGCDGVNAVKALRDLAERIEEVAREEDRRLRVVPKVGVLGADRYGDRPPDPRTMCPGKCEGMGVVPVQGPVPPAYRGVRGPVETDPELLRRWAAAEKEAPTADGVHFVTCPTCEGSGLRPPRSPAAPRWDSEDPGPGPWPRPAPLPPPTAGVGP